jgi:hypothetical protein
MTLNGRSLGVSEFGEVGAEFLGAGELRVGWQYESFELAQRGVGLEVA